MQFIGAKKLLGFGLISLIATAAMASTPLSSTPGHARRPQLAYAGGILHAVDFEAQNIVYYRSADRGRTWSAPLAIGNASVDWNPVLCAARNFVYLAWWSDTSARGIFEVRFTRSLNGGVSFESPQTISADDRKASFVSSIDTTADGARVIVSYWDQRIVGSVAHSNIFARVSGSSGAAGTWSPETLVNDANRILDFEHPVARFLPNGNLSIMFQSNPHGFPQGGLGPTDIQHTLSLNGGQSYFQEPNFVSESRPTVLGAKLYPNSVVDAQGTIHAAWYGVHQGRNVYYAKSEDGGLIWSAPLKLSNHKPFETLAQDEKPGRPAIVVLGSRVEVYWVRPERNLASGDGGGTLFRAVSTSNGVTFSSSEPLANAGTVSHPVVASDGQDVFLLYTGERADGRTGLMFDLVSKVSVPLLDHLGLLLVLGGFTVMMRRGSRARVPAWGARTLVAGMIAAGTVAATAEAQETSTVQALVMDGGTVNSLHRTTAGVLFAATDGSGVYKSTDGGANWVLSSSGLGDLFVESIDGDGLNMLLAGTSRGIYRSTDGGKTWQQRVRARVNTVRCVRPEAKVCYAATQSAGVLKSVNGGQTWASSGLAGLQSMEVNTLDVGAGRVWIGTNGQGVHVSQDSGATWQKKMTGLEVFGDAPYVSRIEVDPSNPNVVYFGSLGELAPASLPTPSGDVYVTYTAGTVWQKLTAPEPFFGVAGLAFGAGRLFVGTNLIGLFASAGAPGSSGFSKILRAVHVRDVVADPSGQNIWVAVRGGGVFRSTDGGTTFSQSSRGLRAFAVRDLAVSGQQVFAAVAGGVLRSTNAGASFAWANAGLGTGDTLSIDMLAVVIAGEGRVYASSQHDGFYVSDNDGTNWTRRDPPNPRNLRGLAIGQTKDHVIVGGYQGSVYSSTDAGRSWRTLALGQAKAFVSSISVNPLDAAQFIVGSFNQRTFATANGSSFSMIAQPTTDDHKVPFHELLTLPALNLQVAATGEGMMTRSLSYGASPSWVRRLGGVEDSYFTAVVAQPGNPSKLVSAAYGSGLYVSNDGGMNWTKVNAALRSRSIQTLAASGANVLVGTVGDGIYSLPWP